MLEFSHIYPMDAVYDTPEDVPEDVSLLRMKHTLTSSSMLP